MSEIKIDRDVPVPEFVDRRPNKYPWREMEVGDSIFIPSMTAPRIGGTLHPFQRRSGRRFTCRTCTENGVDGVRVWRIE